MSLGGLQILTCRGALWYPAHLSCSCLLFACQKGQPEGLGAAPACSGYLKMRVLAEESQKCGDHCWQLLTPVQSAEVRFGVIWPEGPAAAAVKAFRGVRDSLTWAGSSFVTTSFSMHRLFLQRSVCVCCRGRSCRGIAATG